MGDVRDALETVATAERKARIAEGSTTSTNTDELIDSGATFTDSVTVGDTVLNQTDRTTTTVLSIDSDTTLTLNADIMASGDEYSIQASAYTTTAGNKNIFSLAINNAQSDWTNTVVTGSRIRDTDYTDVSTVIDYLRKSTLQ
jgi:glutaminase